MSLPVSARLLTRRSVAPAASRRIDVDFFFPLSSNSSKICPCPVFGCENLSSCFSQLEKKTQERAEHLRMLCSLSLREAQIAVSF